MTRSIEKDLASIGIQVKRTKKHVKLHYKGKLLYTAPSSASDRRAGANLASVICRELLLNDE